MKMKNMLIGGMSLALVACITIGGTLAYLTATDDELTNTFTFANNIKVDLYEEDTIGKGNNKETGKNYTNLVAKQQLDKDVDVEITTSFDTWVLVKVSQVAPADKPNALDMDLATTTVGQITNMDWAPLTYTEGEEPNVETKTVPGVYWVKFEVEDGEAVEGDSTAKFKKYDVFENVNVPNATPTDIEKGLKNIVIDVFAVQTEGVADAYAAYQQSEWYTPATTEGE